VVVVSSPLLEVVVELFVRAEVWFVWFGWHEYSLGVKKPAG
jgi:hypothetical protein